MYTILPGLLLAYALHKHASSNSRLFNLIIKISKRTTTHSLKDRDSPEGTGRVSRLGPPELFVACHAVRAAVSLGSSEVLVGREVSEGEFVLVSVL
jgi:hypothetical protein